MKRIKFFLSVLLLIWAANCLRANTPVADTMPIFIMNRAMEGLQNLTSCSFTVYTNYDVYSESFGNVEHSQKQEIILKFPNKFKINSKGDRGHNALFYDGKTLTYYSFLKNHYAQNDFKKTILELIDTLHRSHSIDFPAGDFFYPDFLEDLLATKPNLTMLGLTEIYGKQCFHIAGKNDEMAFQFWIEDGIILLPIKMQIIYLKEDGMPRYEAYYTDWRFNEAYNDAIFSFKVPPKASIINFNSYSK